ncbi:MAG: hypothetical protein KJ077_36630 [Anaerolineae bacterium]|nr:hypothetical protein [Anaerolineae bacterium]
MQAYKLWTDDEIEQLKQHISNGLTYVEIGKLLNRHTGSIASKCKNLDLRSDKAKRLREVDELKAKGLKLCWKCNTIKPLTSENFRRGFGYCRECERDERINREGRSIEGGLKSRRRAAQMRSLRRGIPFSITDKDLMELWTQQQGKCSYTGVQMTVDGDNHFSVSIDKIEPEKGYIKGNIVLCCSAVNRMKWDMSLDELKHWCHRILDYQV